MVMKSISHLIDTKINRLTIVEDLGMINKTRMVVAICDCGISKTYAIRNIINQSTKSCGCFNLDRIKKHGVKSHSLYDVYRHMIDRCYNENCKFYYAYGGNGVTVCDEWKNSIKSFYDWAILTWKKGLELDKDKLSPTKYGKLYCPEYCCFITRKENAHFKKNNRIIEYNGVSRCMAEWSEMININYGTLKARLNMGWPMERIINTSSDEYHNRKKLAS